MLARDREQSTPATDDELGQSGYRRGSVKAAYFVKDETVLYFDCDGGYMKLWVC